MNKNTRRSPATLKHAAPIALEEGQFPPELVDFVKKQAEQDAQEVAELIARTAPGLSSPPGLTLKELLALGALLKLRRWETLPFDVLVFPDVTSRQVLCQLRLKIATGTLDSAQLQVLARRLVKTSTENFAWTARGLFDSEVLVGAVTPDELVDAMADLMLSLHNEKEMNR